PVLVEVDDGVMFVDFDQRARPVRRLHDPIALRPRFHRRLPARLASAAAAATVPAASAPPPATAFPPGPPFPHGQSPTPHLVLIELRGRLLRFFVGRHLDEREAPRASGRSVAHHTYRLDIPSPAEQFLEFRLARAVRQIPDVKPSTHTFSLIRPP